MKINTIRLNALTASTAFWMAMATIPANAANYELATGFDSVSNPGAVWSCGWFSNIGGEFQTLNFPKTTSSENGVLLRAWQYSSSEQPVVNWNGTTNVAIVYGGLSSFAPGDVFLHPGPDGSTRNFGAVRFTLPPNESGLYRLETTVAAVLTNGPASDTDFYVVKNGREVVGWVLPAGKGVGYTNQMQLGPGETVDFLIGRGADGHEFGGGLKIRAKLFSSTNVVIPPVVVPPGLVLPNRAVTNDLARGSGTLVNAGYRVQEVYGASQFGGVTGAIAITELRFRPDYYYGKAFNTVISNLQISLSTTPKVPGALSTVYSNNIGADARTVFSGSLSVSSAFSGPEAGPKAFDIVVPLQTPFVYEPARGSLLVDVKNISGSAVSLLSGLANSLNEASRVGGSLSSAAGVADNYADALLVVYTPTNVVIPPVVPSGLVVPNRMKTNDAAFGAGTLANAAHRSQQVYAASQFGGVTGAIAITELRFRPDYYYGKAFSAVVSNLQISLSTTLAAPEALSATFSNNVGTDATTVFSGALSVSSSFAGPANGPKAFDIVVALQTPFIYQPGRGNLLVDIKNFSGSTASLLSGQGVNGDGAARVLGGVNAPAGVPDIGCDALQIAYTPAIRPSPQPYMGKFQRIANNDDIVLTLDAVAESEYRIDASTNLVDWVLIASFTASSTGSHSITDVDATQYSSRFYRVIVIPRP